MQLLEGVAHAAVVGQREQRVPVSDRRRRAQPDLPAVLVPRDEAELGPQPARGVQLPLQS